eukprot:CAMPEP_0118705530 /NCGR_PEP_ID=MMETSP0800-20121206/19917_1 /TAXON_ID=210618 ORGANISM="Striatella unipunctata, Strain CCMP2910" /NCGR_SAMPLE_ID=MMETSP0800 /ASSEMBLY_ACC=CAM_ASM_000638 /LENGTH=236 /DNA_ID=CAMNT_0006607691 /DNA_START=87 /DNA_END=795 /DNA_ORIENTATION=+
MTIQDALRMAETILTDEFHVQRILQSIHRVPCDPSVSKQQNTHERVVIPIGALVYPLGRVVSLFDLQQEQQQQQQDDYDWTVVCRSRVVGCLPPHDVIFREFRHLNPDARDARYASPQGVYESNCGFDKVLLTWSGVEYMYHVLQHNSCSIPDVGYRVLRLFTLQDWHTKNEYSHLANDDDVEAKALVAEFDQLRQEVALNQKNAKELSDEGCDNLWNSYYRELVAKYECGGLLQW